MKRVICLLFALAVCMTLAAPVLADETDFVPSIPYKGAPDIVLVEDPDGNPAIGIIRDEEGEIVDYIYEPCLVITPVAEATTSPLIPDAAEEMLLSVYGQLLDGTMTIPYEKHSANLDSNAMVIRDLYDASWLCSDHPVIVAEPGVVVELIFDLGIDKDVDIYCMTYKNNEWNPIVSLVNNGDGTITCVFEDFCPIEFSVEQRTPAAETGDTMDFGFWIAVMIVSAVAVVVLLVVPKIRKKER